LFSGVVLAVFVTLHLINHSLGLVSIDAMEALRRLLSTLWSNPLGMVLLYGSLLTHSLLALWGLFQKRSLRLRPWELGQLVSGLLIAPLLAAHVIGTRGVSALFQIQASYEKVLTALWFSPAGVRQLIAVVVVWTHLAVGLHYWLRVYPWYRKSLVFLYPAAVLIPVLALLGYVRGGLDIEQRAAEASDWFVEVFAEFNALTAGQKAFYESIEPIALSVMAALLIATLLAREARRHFRNRNGRYRVGLPSGKTVTGHRGTSVLEALRAARVPHASVCGGRGRCTTCRVRIEETSNGLEPPNETEQRALNRINAPEDVRLACQLRPRANIRIVPLLAATATAGAARRPGGLAGREQSVAILFLDLRESTALAERMLPYDVVFVLNQFFAEMSTALESTGGHYAQFNGDGLMALYGLGSDLPSGCRDAVYGSIEMLRRLQQLNLRHGDDHGAILRVGIGIHSGEAIVGRMGPPKTPIVSALGDNVNVAARLESLTKSYECSLVVSRVTAELAGLDLTAFPVHQAPIKGRNEPIEVYAVKDPMALVGQFSPADGLAETASPAPNLSEP
jgi:adenylate cyclase